MKKKTKRSLSWATMGLIAALVSGLVALYFRKWLVYSDYTVAKLYIETTATDINLGEISIQNVKVLPTGYVLRVGDVVQAQKTFDGNYKVKAADGSIHVVPALYLK